MLCLLGNGGRLGAPTCRRTAHVPFRTCCHRLVCNCTYAGLLLKSVASGAIDTLFPCAECEDHFGSDFVHIVRSGAGRGGTERSIEDAIMHVGGPPLVCV